MRAIELKKLTCLDDMVHDTLTTPSGQFSFFWFNSWTNASGFTKFHKMFMKINGKTENIRSLTNNLLSKTWSCSVEITEAVE